MVFQIHVYEDGDTEIRQVEKIDKFSSDLFFETVEEVSGELVSYGIEEDAITEALSELSNNPTEWVQV